MTTLTLPIVVGKKYVRRDGEVVTPEKYCGYVTVFADNEPRSPHPFSYMAFPPTGRINDEGDQDTPRDLVADYIEPAKGHPHAALMAEFAKDAAETNEPWKLWQFFFEDENEWTDIDECPYWEPQVQFRRKPAITPDPHAENAAEYAKDMAETDKAWERWEYQHNDGCFWERLNCHPIWNRDLSYRRKEQS